MSRAAIVVSLAVVVVMRETARGALGSTHGILTLGTTLGSVPVLIKVLLEGRLLSLELGILRLQCRDVALLQAHLHAVISKHQ